MYILLMLFAEGQDPRHIFPAPQRNASRTLTPDRFKSEAQFHWPNKMYGRNQKLATTVRPDRTLYSRKTYLIDRLSLNRAIIRLCTTQSAHNLNPDQYVGGAA